MSQAEALQTTLTTFVQRMTQPFEVGDVLEQLVSGAVTVLGVGGCGVTLVDPGGTTREVAASDDRARRTEALESELQQGPCIACITDRNVKVITDLEQDMRWPSYREVVLPLGWRSALGVPLLVADECIGGLDIYGDQPRPWNAEELRTARLLADMAASYIVHARALGDARTLAEQLRHALDSRVLLEQAKGVVAARLEVDVDQAFSVLRRHARDNNLKLRDVARQVVEEQSERQPGPKPDA